MVLEDMELHTLLSASPIEVTGKVGPAQMVAQSGYGVDVRPGAVLKRARKLVSDEIRFFRRLVFRRQIHIMRRQLLLRSRLRARPPLVRPAGPPPMPPGQPHRF